jgi:uncharacterized protein DUF1918
MSTQENTAARRGDWLDAHNVSGGGRRRAEILEVLGHAGHERYRVRWDDGHESICYPADGVTVVPRHAHAEPPAAT